MSKRRLFILCAALALILQAAISTTRAQTLPAPIILYISGEAGGTAQDMQSDLWELTNAGGSFKRRTSWGYNNDPASVSPDGKWIAYRSIAQVGVTAMKEQRFPRGIGEQTPYTIWLLSMDGKTEKRMGEQPANAVLADAGGKPDFFITRSNPVWSPDSKRLAWLESTVTNEFSSKSETRLISYDLAAGTQTILTRKVPLSPGYEGLIFPDVTWGDNAIAIRNVLFEGMGGGGGVSKTEIRFYSPDNGSEIGTTGSLPETQDFAWIRLRAGDQLLLTLPDYKAYDPKTGEEIILNGLPELYSPNAPDAYAWRVDPQANTWTEIAPDGSTTLIDALKGTSSLRTHEIAIAPDGNGLAFIRQFNVNIRYKGSASTPKAPGRVFSVAWGATAWRESAAN